MPMIDNDMNTLITLYGLPYCDATKAVIKWLENRDLNFHLHNYKTDGITKEKLLEWSKKAGWDKLLNKRSTTWRSFSKEVQDAVLDEATAIDIMMKNTSLIKRPVIEYKTSLLLGYDEKQLIKNF